MKIKFHKERYIVQSYRNGSWTFRVRCKGTDKSFCEKDYLSSSKAFQCAVEYRNSLLTGMFVPTDITVDSCFWEIPEVFVMRSETQRKMECYYSRYISNKDKKISDITRADIVSDLNRMVDSCTNDVIKRVMAIWHKIFTLAIYKNYIEKDVSLNIRVPQSHRLKSIGRNELTNEQTLETLSEELAKRLKQPLERKQARYILFTLFYTGMRPAELFALNVDDVNLKKREIRVNKELESDRNKKDVIRPCKTEMSHRVVPISDKLYEILKDYEPNGSVYFGTGDKHYPILDIGNRYHQIAKSIGIDFHLYQCRHTFITRLYLSGVDLKSIQEIVGQNVDATTIGYVVTDKERKAKAVNLM